MQKKVIISETSILTIVPNIPGTKMSEKMKCKSINLPHTTILNICVCLYMTAVGLKVSLIDNDAHGVNAPTVYLKNMDLY